MEIIRHRVNTCAELTKVAPKWGCEIDLRTRGSEIILNHEAFADGDKFSDFAAAWATGGPRGTLILNPKEDGLEDKTLETLKRHRIENYFFLDLTLPTTVRLTMRESNRHVAVRVSEYESADNALRFAGKADWAWVDCFAGEPLPTAVFEALKGKFRLCLVSPELQGYPPSRIGSFLSLRTRLDAVCTKHPDIWSQP